MKPRWLGVILASLLAWATVARAQEPPTVQTWVRGPDMGEMAAFVDVTDRGVQARSGAARMLFVLQQRPPAELSAYFILTVQADCANGSVTGVQIQGFDRDGRDVAGEERSLEELVEASRITLPLACGLANLNITGEAFPSALDAAARVWRDAPNGDLPDPSPFQLRYLGEGGSIDNPMAVYVETSTVSSVGPGRTRMWVLRVWRHPAPFPNSDRETRFILRLVTYDCARRQWRADVGYGNDARTGNTLFVGAVDQDVPIMEYSSDEDELAFACNPGRRSARRPPLIGISAAIADTMRRFP